MSDWRMFDLRLQLECILTEREAMLAENHVRAVNGHAQAYDEEAFMALYRQIQQLIDIHRSGT